MKRPGSLLVLFLFSASCVGSIGSNTGSGTSNGGSGSQPGNGPSSKPGDPSKAGPMVTPPAVDTCGEDTLAKPRAWRLTHAQVRNTLRDGLGFAPPVIDTFPSEARIDATNSRNGFANRADQLTISPLLADYYFKASEELATEVASKPGDFGMDCQMAELAPGACLSGFIDSFGVKMWRRPLTTQEKEDLVAFFSASAEAGGGPEGGLKNLVQAFFLSPNFLYRSEVGSSQTAGETTHLTDYELASALSFTLWDTAPDAELMELASKGELSDPMVRMNQARRMLTTVPRTAPAFHSFVEQWLHTEDIVASEKDPTVFSLGTPELAQDLLVETQKLVDSVLFDAGGDRKFETLFTANYGFVNERSAAVYGVEGVTGDQLQKKDMDPSQRRGILTQASFMWGHANPDGTHPVERGRYFREEVLCEGVPDPPPTVIVDPKFGDATLTARERLAIHLGEPACAACHQLIDGLGLAMENYDGIGRYRTEEVVQGGVAKPIDATGSVPLPSDGTVLEFKNLIDLVDQLAQKPDIYSCFASQYMDYVTGRRPGELDTCERKLITDAFAESGFRMDTLVLNVVGSPSFSARRN